MKNFYFLCMSMIMVELSCVAAERPRVMRRADSIVMHFPTVQSNQATEIGNTDFLSCKTVDPIPEEPENYEELHEGRPPLQHSRNVINSMQNHLSYLSRFNSVKTDISDLSQDSTCCVLCALITSCCSCQLRSSRSVSPAENLDAIALQRMKRIDHSN